MNTRFNPPFRTDSPPQWRGACAAVAGGGPNRATAIAVARRPLIHNETTMQEIAEYAEGEITARFNEIVKAHADEIEDEARRLAQQVYRRRKPTCARRLRRPREMADPVVSRFFCPSF